MGREPFSLGGYGRQGQRMKVGLNWLTFFINRLHLVATAIFLKAAYHPAFFCQHFLKFFDRLPCTFRTRIAGGSC